ncbi:MAG: SMP-30/gluconolactonase/LRE family protein [Thermoanaerobaculia bacterium]
MRTRTVVPFLAFGLPILGLFSLAVPVQAATPAAPPAPVAGLSTGAPAPASADLAAAQTAFATALEQREKKDLPAYRAGLERAVLLLPDPSRLLYRLAVSRLLTGDRPGAVAAYRAQVDAGFFRDPRKDPELAPLLTDPEFQAALVRLEALLSPIAASAEAFRLVDRDLIEGIAHDPKTGAFFLSSVHQRKIVRRSAEGKISDFVASGDHGLLSALGMAVDASHRRLWVVSAGLPHSRGAKPEEQGKSALFAFDLDTGAWIQTIPAPAGEHNFNDLELAADGTVYVSDPKVPAIYRVLPDGRLETLIAGAERLGSPGGLALSADGKILYLADWNNGLAAIALTTPPTLTWMRPPPGMTVLGVDGLRRQGNRLIGIQNGVPPARIASFELAADGMSLPSGKLLERNLPQWDEPTLGVIVDGELFYVSDSHWPAFGEDGAPPADLATLAPPIVRRLRLD